MMTKEKTQNLIKTTSLILILFCINVFANIDRNNLNNHDDHFLVGTRYYKWTDSSRLDEMYEKNSYRELHIQVWFPIDEEKVNVLNHKRAKYLPEFQKAKPFLTNWTKQDILAGENARTNSLITTQISNSKNTYPVLIFSPGLGGHTSFMSFYAERLANSGYIVVGVNHKYDSNYIINKNGKIIKSNLKFYDDLKSLKIPEEISADEYREQRGKRVKILGEDLIFCLNQLAKINKSDFKGKMNLSTVGVFGHSIGGAAAIDAAKLDNRFKAVLNTDGTPSGWALRTGVNPPFMYIEDLKDISHKGNKIQYDRRNNFCKKVKSDCYRIMLPDINHNSFMDYHYHEAINDKQRKKALKTMNTTLKFMTLFFDKYLKNQKIKINNDAEILRFIKKQD